MNGEPGKSGADLQSLGDINHIYMLIRVNKSHILMYLFGANLFKLFLVTVKSTGSTLLNEAVRQ